MKGKLFFYKKTTYPSDAHYYNITKGFAGYQMPRKGEPLYHGTVNEFEEYLATRKRPSRRVQSLTGPRDY